MKDIIIAVAIEQAESGKYDDLPKAFEQPPDPPSFLSRVWYQIQVVFGMTNFKSETLTFPQQASLKRFFTRNEYNREMLVGMNFCVLLYDGRIENFYFHNAAGVREARAIIGLVDMKGAMYDFHGYDGYISYEECVRWRNVLMEEPEFRSEMRIFDKNNTDMDEESLASFILADSDFMQLFVSNHVDELVYEHYLYLQQKHKREILQSLQQDDLLGDRSDSSTSTGDSDQMDINYIPPHPAFSSNKGFSELPWEGIRIGCCPSFQESVAQGLAHIAMMEKFPDCKLVAREIVLDGLSYDLIYELNGEYIILEAKGKGFPKCKKQGQVRYDALKKLDIPLLGAYAYSSDSFRRVK
jgi:hypothetical protein